MYTWVIFIYPGKTWDGKIKITISSNAKGNWHQLQENICHLDTSRQFVLVMMKDTKIESNQNILNKKGGNSAMEEQEYKCSLSKVNKSFITPPWDISTLHTNWNYVGWAN